MLRNFDFLERIIGLNLENNQKTFQKVQNRIFSKILSTINPSYILMNAIIANCQHILWIPVLCNHRSVVFVSHRLDRQWCYLDLTPPHLVATPGLSSRLMNSMLLGWEVSVVLFLLGVPCSPTPLMNSRHWENSVEILKLPLWCVEHRPLSPQFHLLSPAWLWSSPAWLWLSWQPYFVEKWH